MKPKATLARLRWINMALTLIGALVFVGLFAYVTFAPDDFDKRSRDFAIAKVQDKVDVKLAEVAESEAADQVIDLAGKISSRLQERLEAARGSLDAGSDVFIADILAAACKLDCERRDDAQKAVRAFYESSILRHSMALGRVQSFVEGEYDEVMGELRGDLRIFAGSSAIALAFAFFLAVFKGRAAAHLLPISIALTVSTLLMVVWYLFGQDWVMTVLFSNYWGWSYAVFLGGLSFLMVDIAGNKARVTSFVFNSIGNVFGGISDFTPC